MRLDLAAAAFGTLLTSSHPNNNIHISSKQLFYTCSYGTRKDTKLHSQKQDFPDYGQTPVEIDKIRLEKIQKWRRNDLDGQSLVKDTLKELETDEVFQATKKALEEIGLEEMTAEERRMRKRALNALGIPNFGEFVRKQSSEKLESGELEKDYWMKRSSTKVLQLNIGLYCNQACAHCHVESSPQRTETMTTEVATQCLELLKASPDVTTLDITGGAPELNESFRLLVRLARELRPDLDIIDRCNLTVLHEPGQEDLVEFLQENRVHIIASLPCYSSENVNQQRGRGVFDRSISALLKLNEVGYGIDGSGLLLDLVYNPLGAFLPPEQGKLEVAYKQRLDEDFGIQFNNLFTITNMPIKRFADFLHRRDELQGYMDLLVRNFNLDTTNTLMCKDTISIGYDGKIFDCDFNQQLGIHVGTKGSNGGVSVFDINSLSDLENERIIHDNHCFGCTAGMGSS